MCMNFGFLTTVFFLYLDINNSLVQPVRDSKTSNRNTKRSKQEFKLTHAKNIYFRFIIINYTWLRKCRYIDVKNTLFRIQISMYSFIQRKVWMWHVLNFHSELNWECVNHFWHEIQHSVQVKWSFWESFPSF